MSMGSDLAHDADTLRIHYDMREQHITIAAIKAMRLAAREFDAAADMADRHHPTTSSHAHQAGVCAAWDCVRCDTLAAVDSEGGDCA